MATPPKLSFALKGDPETNKLGDCPFCHRVLLTLEQKGVAYDRVMIDFAKKPEWLLEKSGGKVPVMIEGDKYTPDSDVLVDILEQRYAEPSMKSSVPPEVGGKLFPAFREYLMSSGGVEEEAKKGALLDQLKIVNDYLADKGPLFGGGKLNATDAAFAPKLHHCIVALGHFKGWKLPADFSHVQRYYDAVKALPEWKRAEYGDDTVIAGWERHGAKKA